MRPSTLMMLALSAAAGSSAFGAINEPFIQREDWTTNVSAQVGLGRLILTPAERETLGTAFYNERQQLNTGFDMTFDYLAQWGSLGSGLAFVIQDVGANVRGTGGSQLGVGGIKDAVVIGLKTGSDQRVEIQVADTGTGAVNFYNSPLAARAVSSSVLRTNNDRPNQIRVVYVPGSLDIYLNGQILLRGVPINLENVNGRSVLGADGKAYVGFSAANSYNLTDYQAVSAITLNQIPAPGAAALMGLGGLAMARRRRR